MTPIKFGTDGWRAVIADDMTTANVQRVAQATAHWIKQQTSRSPSVIIGHDCRFAGELFAETTAQVMAEEGITVRLDTHFASTPMVSLAVAKQEATAGVIITASHNPPEYNGFKIKAHYGGPATPAMIDEVEQLLPEAYSGTPEPLGHYREQGLVADIDLETLYVEHARAHFDLKAIQESGLHFAFDAMYGAGQHVIQRLLPNVDNQRYEHNPGFHGTPPEPIMKNLEAFSQYIQGHEHVAAGLAVDGDADRIGLLNSNGDFIDSHHILLILIQYLNQHKGMDGQVMYTFSCTSRIQQLCEQYELPTRVTKIGFKYICDLMQQSDQPTLVGGEESGGIAIRGHIPERDGIWVGLTIWEFMAKTGKSLDDLIQEVYKQVGAFSVERNDLHIDEALKQETMRRCEESPFQEIGSYTVTAVEDLDGYKFHLGEERWVMIRPSGTEPVLRVYAQAGSQAEAYQILQATEEAITSGSKASL